jgi:DNA-binding transcriptional LysR family regulator
MIIIYIMNHRHLIGADLNLLLVFDAIYKKRSITRAAEWLRVTQSAVSHALQRLRELADDPLFVRGDRGVVPTPRAEAMAEDVAASLHSALSALQRPDIFDPMRVEASFKLGLTDYGTAVLLPSLRAALTQVAPNIRLVGIAIDARSPIDDLEAGTTDLAFGAITEVPTRFSYEPIVHDELVCVIAEGKHCPAVELNLQTYLALPHLIISYRGDPKSWVDEHLAASGLKRYIGLSVPHGLAIDSLLPGTNLIATIARGVAERSARHAALRIFPHPLGKKQIIVSQFWHKRFDADPLHQFIRGIAKECFKSS